MAFTPVRFQFESATATLKVWGQGSATLIDVYSEKKRLGHATQLLKLITDYADKNQLIIVLAVGNYGDARAMTNQQLIEFYSKFGFLRLSGGIPGSKPIMQRDPIS